MHNIHFSFLNIIIRFVLEKICYKLHNHHTFIFLCKQINKNYTPRVSDIVLLDSFKRQINEIYKYYEKIKSLLILFNLI